MQHSIASKKFSKTRLALFWMHLANEPFVALFTLLGFILKKELGASTLQLSIFATLSPVISFFSFYWSSYITRNHNSLIGNLIGSWILGRLPFLCFPFFSNIWYLIGAASIYQLFYRASTPALMEILKQNVEKKQRTSLFSSIYFLSFLESILLGFFIGKVLDFSTNNWKILISAAAFLSISSIFFQKKIPLQAQHKDKNFPCKASNPLIQPWKDCLYLMKRYPQFANFQWGFMIGGFGLMIINPALIIYYNDTLHLSHEILTSARYVWMGLGVLASTYLWQIHLSKKNISLLTCLIIIGFGLFPLLILYAQHSLFFFYFAFLIYGIAQAGSHLLWHLSGTFFASEDESSSKYTGTNVLMVGIRGLIGPLLGGILTAYLGPKTTLLIGAFICLSGGFFMHLKSFSYQKTC